MEKLVTVTIRYLDGRVGHSRYGNTARVETVVRHCTEEELDVVVAQFRKRGEIVEVKINR